MADFYNEEDSKYTEIAELTTTCNKYHPGKQTFYLPSLNPMNERPNSVTTVQESPNLENADSTAKGTSVECGSNLVLELPKEIARNYPKKFIPPGTRFLVTFVGGDISKPMIIGRDYDGYEVQNS